MLRTLPFAAPIIVLPLLAIAIPGWWGPLWGAAIWGLGIVACFVGWGSLVGRRLVPTLERDIGLRASWGMALTVVVGGPLCLVGAARRPVLLAWLFGGIALAARDAGCHAVDRSRALRRGAPWPQFGADALVLAGLLVLVAFVYLGAATRGGPNPSDDFVAYLPFIHKILQTGTLVEPFSVRRMAAYGGQSFLQAFLLLGADDAQIQLFDQGVCFLILVGLILGFRRLRRRASRVLVLLLVLVVIMLPEVRINSASEVSGALMFLAAFRTLVLVERSGLRGWKSALLVALPLAAVSTLRQNFQVVAGFMIASLLLPRGDDDLSARARRFGEVASLTAVCLIPWAALAFHSNHTFLFPIFPGNYDPHYAGITGSSTTEARLKFYLGTLFHDEPIRAMPLLILAAPAVARAANRRTLLALWLGTIVGFAFVSLNLPDSDNFTVARYGFASVVALAVAAGLAAAERLPSGDPRSDPAAMVIVAVALGIQIHATHTNALRNLTGALGRIYATDRSPPPLAATAPEVLKMQAAVPPGERMLVLIERPYLLDFARNPIALFDQPGAVSPHRALPLLKGPEPIAQYLLREGYRYFAFNVPDAAQNDLYRRAHWKGLLTGQQKIWRNTAPLYLAAFDAADHFARTRRRLYDDGHLVVVDLATPAS